MPLLSSESLQTDQYSKISEKKGKLFRDKIGRFGLSFKFSIVESRLSIETMCEDLSDKQFAFYVYRNGALVHKQGYGVATRCSIEARSPGFYHAMIFVKRKDEHYSLSDTVTTKPLSYKLPEVETDTATPDVDYLQQLIISTFSAGGNLFDALESRGYTRPALYSTTNNGVLLWLWARHNDRSFTYLLSNSDIAKGVDFPSPKRNITFDNFFLLHQLEDTDVILLADPVDRVTRSTLDEKFGIPVISLSELFENLYANELFVNDLLDLSNRNPEVPFVVVNTPSVDRIANKSEHESNIRGFIADIREKIARGESVEDDPVWGVSGYSADEILEVTAGSGQRFVNGINRLRDRQGKNFNVVEGFRVTTDTPPTAEHTVYMFGPSLQIGMGTDDSHTIASCLQRLIVEAGLSFTVVNCANYYGADDDKQIPLMRSIDFRPGDIVICMETHPGRFEQLGRFFPICDVQSVFDRPHEHGEVFWDPTHLNANGYGLIAKTVFDFAKTEGVFQQDYEKPVFEMDLSSTKSDLSSTPLISRGDRRELMEFITEIRDEQAKMGRPHQIGAIVMNCNPFTRGHRHLIEYAAARVLKLYIFVVQEDRYYFPFEERIELVRQGTDDLSNVTVVPGGQFIISQRTFAAYSNKDVLQHETVDASLDIELFAQVIAPSLGITIRFAGEEPLDNVTNQYNATMQRVLPQYSIDFHVIPRKEQEGTPISASRVRSLMTDGDLDGLDRLVPPTTLSYLMAQRKQGSLDVDRAEVG